MSIRNKITIFLTENADWIVVGLIFTVGFVAGAVVL